MNRPHITHWMDQTCPESGRSPDDGGTFRDISCFMRAAPTAAGERCVAPKGADHPIRS